MLQPKASPMQKNNTQPAPNRLAHPIDDPNIRRNRQKYSFTDLEVLYEDNHLIAINKIVGLPVQSDKSGDTPLLEYVKDYIKHQKGKQGEAFAELIHRIDRPVSGIVLCARTSKCLERMNELFKKRQLTKTYYALVKNKPKESEGKLIHYLQKDAAKNKSTAYMQNAVGRKESELEYKILGPKILVKSDSYFLLEVKLVTGRHHQIRVQLARIGCPIKGDIKYGYNSFNDNGSISLHARSIQFEHPISGAMIELSAPFPSGDIWDHVKQIPLLA